MITPEINDAVNKFGAIVEALIEKTGHVDACGNQVMFTRDPQTKRPMVMGVCFMLPHVEKGIVYYRALIDGTVTVMAPGNDGAPAEVEDVTVLGEEYVEINNLLGLISKHLILSTFANFIVEKQEIVLAVQAAANMLNTELDNLYPNPEKEAEQPAAEAPAEEAPVKKTRKRRSKKIEINSETPQE